MIIHVWHVEPVHPDGQLQLFGPEHHPPFWQLCEQVSEVNQRQFLWYFTQKWPLMIIHVWHVEPVHPDGQLQLFGPAHHPPFWQLCEQVSEVNQRQFLWHFLRNGHSWSYVSDMLNQSTLMGNYTFSDQSTSHRSSSPSDSQLKKLVYSEPMQQNSRQITSLFWYRIKWTKFLFTFWEAEDFFPQLKGNNSIHVLHRDPERCESHDPRSIRILTQNSHYYHSPAASPIRELVSVPSYLKSVLHRTKCLVLSTLLWTILFDLLRGRMTSPTISPTTTELIVRHPKNIAIIFPHLWW